MSVDDALPPPSLPPRAGPAEIARHFPATFGRRVDVDGVPDAGMLNLAGARLPDLNEARLLDRVLQLVPPSLLQTVTRIVIVDNGVVGREGGYAAGIVRLYTPVLRLSLPDPKFASRFSLFTTTVLHEIGHAVYAEHLTAEQRARVVDQYLDRLARSARYAEPTERGAQHYFVELLVAALLGFGVPPLGILEVRALLLELGVELR